MLRQDNEAVEIFGHLHDGDRAILFEPERHMDLEAACRRKRIRLLPQLLPRLQAKRSQERVDIFRKEALEIPPFPGRPLFFGDELNSVPGQPRKDGAVQMPVEHIVERLYLAVDCGEERLRLHPGPLFICLTALCRSLDGSDAHHEEFIQV